jgi:hypothetical protein
MSADLMLILGLGALAGGFINGLAGFGTALFALGFWLQVLPPIQAVAILQVVSLVTGAQGLWIVRRHLLSQPRRLARFLAPALFGIPIGILFLQYVEPHVLKLLIASFLILYGVFFIARRALPRFERPTPLADSVVGFIGGLMGGLAGLCGALPAMWCALRPWPRHETRAVLQPFNMTIQGLSALVMAYKGVYAGEGVALAMLVCAVVALTSAQLGLFVFRRINDTQFRWLIIGLMLISGSMLMVQELI